MIETVPDDSRLELETSHVQCNDELDWIGIARKFVSKTLRIVSFKKTTKKTRNDMSFPQGTGIERIKLAESSLCARF